MQKRRVRGVLAKVNKPDGRSQERVRERCREDAAGNVAADYGESCNIPIGPPPV